MKNLNHLATLFLLTIIAICLLASYRLIDPQLPRSTITLLIFNLLFFPLLFQLNGSAFRKVLMLTFGNIVGFSSNLLFYYFSLAGYGCFGVVFNVLYTLIFPFLNLMWIVPFWAISLGFLPRQEHTMGRVEA